MKRFKPLVLALCAVLLVVGTILGTVAYLQDTASVVNTFTVGNVHLKLDEAVVDEKGEPTGGRTETGNAYHLIPGETYTKDPTVTVLKSSEESYVRMMLTLNCAGELDAIFAPNGAVLTEIFKGYDATKWEYVDVTRGNDNTITYEFRYFETVKPQKDTDLVLDALFDTVTVPNTMTGEQLATIADLKITVEAHAIQATGFANADDAWTAFSK
ncbi:MAG: hypothetical protein J6L96_09700 [Clostridia bacterium]|nr:hypothetical protein [Clostridia bacterium]